MKLPDKSRLLEEDFKEQSKWIGKLLYVLNQFMDSVYIAFNKNLSFGDNFNTEYRDLELRSEDLPYTFQHTMKGPCRGLEVVRAGQKEPDGNPLAGGVNFEWEEDGNQVKIIAINGLPANGKVYFFRVRISPE